MKKVLHTSFWEMNPSNQVQMFFRSEILIQTFVILNHILQPDIFQTLFYPKDFLEYLEFHQEDYLSTEKYFSADSNYLFVWNSHKKGIYLEMQPWNVQSNTLYLEWIKNAPV